MKCMIALLALVAAAASAPTTLTYNAPFAYSAPYIPAPVAYAAPSTYKVQYKYAAPVGAPLAYAAPVAAPVAYAAPVAAPYAYSGTIAVASPALKFEAPAEPSVVQTGTKIESTYEPVEQHGYQIVY